MNVNKAMQAYINSVWSSAGFYKSGFPGVRYLILCYNIPYHTYFAEQPEAHKVFTHKMNDTNFVAWLKSVERSVPALKILINEPFDRLVKIRDLLKAVAAAAGEAGEIVDQEAFAGAHEVLTGAIDRTNADVKRAQNLKWMQELMQFVNFPPEHTNLRDSLADGIREIVHEAEFLQVDGNKRLKVHLLSDSLLLSRMPQGGYVNFLMLDKVEIAAESRGEGFFKISDTSHLYSVSYHLDAGTPEAKAKIIQVVEKQIQLHLEKHPRGTSQPLPLSPRSPFGRISPPPPESPAVFSLGVDKSPTNSRSTSPEVAPPIMRPRVNSDTTKTTVPPPVPLVRPNLTALTRSLEQDSHATLKPSASLQSPLSPKLEIPSPKLQASPKPQVSSKPMTPSPSSTPSPSPSPSPSSRPRSMFDWLPNSSSDSINGGSSSPAPSQPTPSQPTPAPRSGTLKSSKASGSSTDLKKVKDMYGGDDLMSNLDAPMGPRPTPSDPVPMKRALTLNKKKD